MSAFENRFAEVQRKSREARAKLDANQQAKAADEERKANAIREQREQPDLAYSEWDAAPPAAPARKREVQSGSESGPTAEPAPASESETDPESGPAKQ